MIFTKEKPREVEQGTILQVLAGRVKVDVDGTVVYAKCDSSIIKQLKEDHNVVIAFLGGDKSGAYVLSHTYDLFQDVDVSVVEI
jgi:hypothetical protein